MTERGRGSPEERTGQEPPLSDDDPRDHPHDVRRDAYAIRHAIPSVETYQRLRHATGLSAKTAEAARRGLPNTLFAVQVVVGDAVVGMGRLIGDGGCFFQVVDVAVLPEHQGRGLGKAIIREIVAYVDRHVPESGYVSLLADGQAAALYAQFGFVHTAPASVGMALRRAGRRAERDVTWPR